MKTNNLKGTLPEAVGLMPDLSKCMPTFHHNLIHFFFQSHFKEHLLFPYCFISQGYLWIDNNEITGLLPKWTNDIVRMGTFYQATCCHQNDSFFFLIFLVLRVWFRGNNIVKQ
jgi:hypothetical protein